VADDRNHPFVDKMARHLLADARARLIVDGDDLETHGLSVHCHAAGVDFLHRQLDTLEHVLAQGGQRARQRLGDADLHRVGDLGAGDEPDERECRKADTDESHGTPLKVVEKNSTRGSWPSRAVEQI
jgi:hypothetical protein